MIFGISVLIIDVQVLSSTNAPGFSLNGEFRGPKSLPTRELSVL